MVITILQNEWKTDVFITSLPSGIPEPRAAVRATTLATPVRNVRYSFKTTPRKIVFISGIPEPENYNKTNKIQLLKIESTAVREIIKMEENNAH